MKKILLASLLFFAVLTLAGCNKETRTDLNFYVWGDATEVSWYEHIARNFETETGIVVNVIPSTGDYYENLNIYLGSRNDAPDIFFTEQGEILSQLAADQLLDLSPYIADGSLDVVTDQNPDGSIQLWDINDAYRYDGSWFGTGDYYAFIKDWTPDFMLWYNKDHIDQYNQSNEFKPGDDGYMNYPDPEIPLTWSEFLDMSHKLTVEEDGVITRYGTMIDRVPWKHVMEWIQMSGATTFIDGKYFNYQDQGVIDAFTYLAQMQVGDLKSSPVIGPSGIGSGEAFANGNLSFAWFGSWAYANYHFDNVAFDIGIAPPPIPDKDHVTANDRYGVSAGMIALAINKQSPLKDKAVQFLNYYMTEGDKYFATKGFNIPGNQAIAESNYYLLSDDSFVQQMNQYFLDFALHYTHAIEYNRYLSQIMIENQIGEHYSTWVNNYDFNTIPEMLAGIANDIRNEID